MSWTASLSVLRAHLWTRLLELLLCCVLGFLGAGCIALLDHQPNERILDTLGVDVARERLRETLLRAVSPRIQTITLTNESLEYRWHPQVGAHIYFVNLSRVEVYENHVVFLRGAGNQILSTLHFGTDQDAKLFADLLMGFRGRYLQRREAQQTAVALPPIDRHLQRVSSGSAFLINAQGDALTNQHVVSDCDEVRVRLATGEVVPAALVVQDRQNDLALLHLSSAPTQWLVFRDGRDAQQGEELVAVGFPLADDLASGAKVTTGVVSALAGMKDDTRFLQISAPVQLGNSGGPLLDMSGNVAGVVSNKLNALRMLMFTGDIPQNINFALKASLAKSFLEATGVRYETRASQQALSTTQVSTQARQSTVFIECWK
jgi:S1-C subfamily serine protease